MRQPLYRQRKGLTATENENHRSDSFGLVQLCVALRFDVPGLEACKIIFAWANLCAPVEGDSLRSQNRLMIAIAVLFVTAGVVADIDDDAVRVLEVTGNLVQCRSQTPFKLSLYTRIAPRWFAILGYPLALLLLLGSFYISSSFFIFPLWVMLLSIFILAANFRRTPMR